MYFLVQWKKTGRRINAGLDAPAGAGMKTGAEAPDEQGQPKFGTLRARSQAPTMLTLSGLPPLMFSCGDP